MNRGAIRSELAARVGARSPEIQQAFLARIGAITDGTMDAEFLVGLRAAAQSRSTTR